MTDSLADTAPSVSSATTSTMSDARTKITRLYRRRRRAGEVATPSKAIANHCRECHGWDADGMGSLRGAVEACTSTECWLWPWRVGSLDSQAWRR